MKKLLLLALGLAVGGGRAETTQPEDLNRLKALQTELAKRSVPVRWAYANKRKIRSSIYERTREKLADLKKADVLSPEVEAQVARYEALHMELIRLPMPRPVRLAPSAFSSSPPLPAPTQPEPPNRLIRPLPPRTLIADPSAQSLVALPPLPLPTATAPVPPPASPAPLSPPAPTAEEKAYAAMTRRVAEAKAPVAAIVERRKELTTKYHSAKFLEQLIADYVKEKEHYDLVVDSSNDGSYDRPVLYHAAAEVPDITKGIIQFFRDKEKP